MKKLFLFFGVLVLFVSNTFAQNLFGVQEAPGCETRGQILPTLVICGRSASVGTCTEYQRPCTVQHLVDTGGRLLIWVLTFAFLMVPLIVMYYGAQIIYQRKFPSAPGAAVTALKIVKENFWRVTLYFILMLCGWLIIRTVVDIFQIDPRINTFLIENGQPVQSRSFDGSR